MLTSLLPAGKKNVLASGLLGLLEEDRRQELPDEPLSGLSLPEAGQFSGPENVALIRREE